METSAKEELVVQGISASQGIAYGQIFLYEKSDVEVPSYQVDPNKRVAEIARFEQALLTTRQQIAKIQDEVEKNLGGDEARIFDAHLMVLEDQALIGETIREFEKTGRNIETCFNQVASRYIKAFDEIDDEYLRERAGDLRDVAQRVLQNLLGQAINNLSRLADKRVVVANDISPSDSASIDRSQALGIVTDTGSKTSHAVIVARSMRIPAVVGVRDLTKKARNGDWAIVDGYEGVVVLNPSEQTLFRYGKIQIQKKSFEQRLLEASRQPAVTLDGVPVMLMANIEKVDETAQAKEFAAEGVGLFRTEYIYLNSARIPTEQEQFLAYKAVAEALAPHPVVIRTLDLGGDKPMASAPELFPKEDNPFMGFRAIRFCLEHVNLFKDQLRAILLASSYGNVRIMYPMISGAEELARANAVLDECKAELKQRGQPFDEKISVGSMIEIPSAAVTADLLARKCGFFSIGTNDLIQYMLAIDRVNDRIAHLYEPTHPAILRMLKYIVEQAHQANIKVAVCGEMAGDPVFAPLLLGLGVDELSMSPTLLPAVKYLVRAMKLSDAKALAEEALTLEDPKKIYAKFDEFYRARVKME
ncbi:MAG TPA: phosphoenolpyruvate--protein phosphotransferase [Opitutaceae bacterium]|jgi:phosphotransferase system enzyme I (PtsI)|nr:phosphoenolpyruvate--protein phosphotransferase [Opitutaceae bacterium]